MALKIWNYCPMVRHSSPVEWGWVQCGVQTEGFGERLWCYSFVINDTKIENLNLKGDLVQNAKTDSFDFSDVGTIINYLKSVKKE